MLPFLSVRKCAILPDFDERGKNRGTAPEKERGNIEGRQLPNKKDSGNVDLYMRERKKKRKKESLEIDDARQSILLSRYCFVTVEVNWDKRPGESIEVDWVRRAIPFVTSKQCCC